MAWLNMLSAPTSPTAAEEQGKDEIDRAIWRVTALTTGRHLINGCNPPAVLRLRSENSKN
jgi:hypothetical protein